MIYKNSIKILLSNFDIVWKTIIYYLFVFALTIFLGYLCVNPVYKILEQSGFIDNIVTVYSEFLTNLNLTQLLVSFDDLLIQFLTILQDNLATVWINFAGLAFVVIFVRTIFSNFTIMASCNSLHYYMGSMNKHGFYASFSETFAKNLRFQLIFFFVNLPIKIVFYLLCFLCLRLFGISLFFTLLAIVLLFLLICFFCAFKHCLFDGWIPTMIVMNYDIFKALKVSIKNSFRIMRRIFGSAVGIVITLILSNFFLGIFTFGFGLIISIPFSYLLASVFGMVITYEGQGMRYYVDVYNVITPKKKEVGDKLKGMKFIV